MKTVHVNDPSLGLSTDSWTPSYRFSQNNPYVHYDSISEFRKTTLICTWQNAIPYLIKPGMSVQFHGTARDKETGVYHYRSVGGQPAKAEYILRKSGNLTDGFYYICNASIQLFLEPQH